ncbi:hypothetical protein FQN54_006301 [Arachnomyces sp. PD_36]|nr:hypothetical protein FQN54_006301 [Arachnomyces sp. PD_36]
MATNWREEYFSALGVRDEREKANVALYDAYTRLADRTGRIEITASSAATPAPGTPNPPSQAQQPIKKPPPKNSSQKPQPDSQQSVSSDLLTTARQELFEAQRSRAELQDRLAKKSNELDTLKKKFASESKRMAAISADRTHLQLKLKDRDEELRGKAKLLDDVQDELVSLNLQFNMAEERSTRLEKENRELVERWMARMGKEADAMNDASRFS